ncbi:MAG: thioesterase family protein [Steroidobacteraceae bacterium]
MTGLAIYRTGIAPEWIDYNGHVRDAYYGLIASHAVDALMDRIGIDARYRQESHCTLYTVETHMHYLREIGANDRVEVLARVLGADRKRLHAALELVCEDSGETAATCEVMLLHVRQSTPAGTTAFPQEVAAAIADLQRTTATLPASGPGSRRMELARR